MAKDIETKDEIKTEKDDGRIDYLVPDDMSDETHAEVWLNGKKFVMKKNEMVRVPKGVKEIHERSLKMKRAQRDKLREAKYR